MMRFLRQCGSRCAGVRVAIFVQARCCSSARKSNREIMTLRDFEEPKNKNRETFLDLIHMFDDYRNPRRKNFVDFIYKAMRYMKEYGVHKDLEVYKKLIGCLPKGQYVPSNMIQAELMFFPQQQNCITDVLEQMEDNGVIPDKELQELLMAIFGDRAFPLRKCWRMSYWMPKFKNLSPWPLPLEMPASRWEIAELAIGRICSPDPQSIVETLHSCDVDESVDDTWILSGQSPVQQRLLREHDVTKPLFVEGPFRLWLRNKQIDYFVLKAERPDIDDEPQKPDYDIDDFQNFQMPIMPYPMESVMVRSIRTVHEQDNEIVFATCVTGTSSHDSLLSWIRLLERKPGNEPLKTVPILFRLQERAGDASQSRLEAESQPAIDT